MFAYVFVVILAVGVPAGVFAQFSERGEYIEVAKGTKLCPNMVLDRSKGMLDPKRGFWRVTSKARANGTQTVAAFVFETVYDRQSGDTTIKESRYDEDYATFFKKDPEHKGMVLMIGPQHGRVEAVVEVCPKRK